MVKEIKKGYTLIELTISIGLLGLVIILTAGVLISVVKSYQRQRVFAEIDRNADYAMRVLEERLLTALSVDCVSPNGQVFNDINLTGNNPCNALDKINPRIIRITTNSVSEPYIYIGAGSANSIGCENLETSPNCFVFIRSSINNISGEGNIADSSKLTNDSEKGGVSLSQFEFIVGGSEPTVVIVTMTVRGANGSIWSDEARTYQNFLTVRSTYK